MIIVAWILPILSERMLFVRSWRVRLLIVPIMVCLRIYWIVLGVIMSRVEGIVLVVFFVMSIGVADVFYRVLEW